MKNKGFTLVELLGVIIILSLIVLIIVPMADKSIKSGKNSADKQLEDDIILAARAWGSDNKEKLPQVGMQENVMLSFLQQQGYINKNVKLPSTGDVFENACVQIKNVKKVYHYTYNRDCTVFMDLTIVGNRSASTWTNQIITLSAKSNYIGTYQWKKNNANISGATAKTYNADTALGTETKSNYNLNLTTQGTTYSSKNTFIAWIDKKAPTVGVSVPTGWTSTNKNITITLSDNGIGTAAYYVGTTNTAPVASSTAWVAKSLASGASGTATVSKGAGTYYVFAKDKLNNISSARSVTVSNIDAANPTLSVAASKTTKSITVTATASAKSGITKYEYSKDNGATWVSGGTSKTHTFTGLKHKTTYNIKVRVTSTVGKQTTSATTAVTTNTIGTPTYAVAQTSTGKNVTITYPSGCGSTYTCSYSKSGGSYITVKGNTTVPFTASGTLVAKVSDGTNTVTASTYTVTITKSTITVTSTLGGSVTVANTTKGTSVTSSNGTKKTISAINGDSIKVTVSFNSGFSLYNLKRGSAHINSGNVSTMGNSGYTVSGEFSYTSRPYKILTAVNNTYGVVFDSAEGKGANAQLYNASKSETQYWNLIVKKVENNVVYYGIESNYKGTRGWYLDVFSEPPYIASKSNAEVWNAWANEPDFYWYLRDAGSGYFYIVNKTGYCLDVYDGKAGNGANVWVYTCNNTTAQKWKFVA